MTNMDDDDDDYWNDSRVGNNQSKFNLFDATPIDLFADEPPYIESELETEYGAELLTIKKSSPESSSGSIVVPKPDPPRENDVMKSQNERKVRSYPYFNHFTPRF